MTTANHSENQNNLEAQGSGQISDQAEYLCPDCGGTFWDHDSEDDTAVCAFCGCWCCGKVIE